MIDAAEYETIQAAIDAGAEGEMIRVNGGAHEIAGLVLQPYQRLELLDGAALTLTEDAHAITMARGAQVCGGLIDVSGVAEFSHAGVYYPGEQRFGLDDLCLVERVRLRNGNHTGVGIHMLGTGGYVVFSRVRDVSIQQFECGLLMDGGGGFVNGNIIESVAMRDCVAFTRLLGTASGNVLSSFQMQVGAWTEQALYCEGRQNMIYGYWIWDWYRAAGTPPTEGVLGTLGLADGMEFTASSRQNHVHTSMVRHRIADSGWNNAVFSTYISS